jgi:hypothetical protein
MSFFRNEGQEGKTGLSGGWCQWERGGDKEKVKEGECGGHIMSS